MRNNQRHPTDSKESYPNDKDSATRYNMILF